MKQTLTCSVIPGLNIIFIVPLEWTLRISKGPNVFGLVCLYEFCHTWRLFDQSGIQKSNVFC